MTAPPTDGERAPLPGAPAAAPPAARGPRGLPQRVRALPVRQRNRVALETLEATFAGLQQVDDSARPATPIAPPPDIWPPVTGSHPLVTGSQPRVTG